MNISKYQEAKKLKQEGKLEEAITAYQEAIELNQNFYSYHHELGEILAAKEDWEGAIASYSKAIELNPKSAWSHHNLGEAFSKIGKPGKAIASYHEAININPKYAGFARSLGAEFYQQGKLQKAINWYLKTVKINPDLSIAYIELAEVLVKQGKLDEAVNKLEKAVEINPKDGEAQKKLADVYVAIGNFELAVNYYQKAIEIKPITGNEREKLQSELVSTKDELEQLRTQFYQNGSETNNKELEITKSKLTETERLLEQSLEQLAQTHKVLDESLEKHRQRESILTQYQEELEITKSKLTETEALLEQSVEQLAETHNVLDESLEKHHQSKSLLKYQNEIQEAKIEPQKLQEKLQKTEALLYKSLEQLDDTEKVLEQCCEKLGVQQPQLELTSEIDSRKYAIITTFSPKGYQEYGRRMLETFDRHLPLEVDIYGYYEGEKPDFQSSRVYYRDLEAASPDLVKFKKECDRDPVKCGKGGKEYNMQLDARRFAHKTFCVIHGTQNIDADIVFWFDADTVALRDVSMSFIQSLLPPEYYTSYLGRGETYSECGFVGYNINHPAHKEFMSAWREVYLSGKLFELSEWHDCTSYDYVRSQLEREVKINSKNLSGNLITGHPFVNTVLGEYFDHLKGIKRKKVGKSLPRDFIINSSAKQKKSTNLTVENTQSYKKMQANYWHPLQAPNLDRYTQVTNTINLFKPTSIIEVGTWNGNRAIEMVKTALNHRKKVHYIGFDLFEDATPQTDAEELNVKKHHSVKSVTARLQEIQSHHPGFTFELVKGNTRETLKQPRFADFAYIDGGHSVETIRGDYEALKQCPVILFDDYYVADKKGRCPNLQKLGCNEVVKNLPHYVLPILGNVKGGGLTAMVLVFAKEMTAQISSGMPTEFYDKTLDIPTPEIVSSEGKLGVFFGNNQDKGPFNNYRQFGTWATELQELLLTKIFPVGSSGTYLDIGAYIGLTVIPITAARKINSFAFEPDPENQQLLNQNIATHKLDSLIKTYPYALLSEQKQVDLTISPQNKGDSRIKIYDSQAPNLKGEASRPIIKVQAESLDNMLSANSLQKPIVVKLAIQGAELEFFQGASKFIQLVDYLIIQFWPYGLRHLGETPETLISALEEQFPFGAILKHHSFQNFSSDYIDKEIEQIKNDVNNLSLEPMTDIKTRLQNEIPFHNIKYTGHLKIICSKHSQFRE